MHVEIWSDIACPWCYIGKRRFEAALEAFEHRDEVTVMWRSFEAALADVAPRAHHVRPDVDLQRCGHGITLRLTGRTRIVAPVSSCP